MGDDGPRTRIAAGVTLEIPRVNVGEVDVDASWRNEECGDHQGSGSGRHEA